MASDNDIVDGMNDWLRARGYECGRDYADVGDLVRGVASLPGETETTVEPKVRRLIANPKYRFKTKPYDKVSASDDQCGR